MRDYLPLALLLAVVATAVIGVWVMKRRPAAVPQLVGPPPAEPGDIRVPADPSGREGGPRTLGELAELLLVIGLNVELQPAPAAAAAGVPTARLVRPAAAGKAPSAVDVALFPDPDAAREFAETRDGAWVWGRFAFWGDWRLLSDIRTRLR